MDVLINIDVEDLDAGVQFYADAFDLQLTRLLFDGSVAELSGASSKVYLLRKVTGSSPSLYTDQVRDYRRHWTPVHLDFVVPDLDIALARAKLAGAQLEGPVEASIWGRTAQLSDPFGNGLCLVEWQGAGYDELEQPAAAAMQFQVEVPSAVETEKA